MDPREIAQERYGDTAMDARSRPPMNDLPGERFRPALDRGPYLDAGFVPDEPMGGGIGPPGLPWGGQPAGPMDLPPPPPMRARRYLGDEDEFDMPRYRGF